MILLIFFLYLFVFENFVLNFKLIVFCVILILWVIFLYIVIKKERDSKVLKENDSSVLYWLITVLLLIVALLYEIASLFYHLILNIFQ